VARFEGQQLRGLHCNAAQLRSAAQRCLAVPWLKELTVRGLLRVLQPSRTIATHACSLALTCSAGTVTQECRLPKYLWGSSSSDAGRSSMHPQARSAGRQQREAQRRGDASSVQAILPAARPRHLFFWHTTLNLPLTSPAAPTPPTGSIAGTRQQFSNDRVPCALTHSVEPVVSRAIPSCELPGSPSASKLPMLPPGCCIWQVPRYSLWEPSPPPCLN